MPLGLSLIAASRVCTYKWKNFKESRFSGGKMVGFSLLSYFCSFFNPEIKGNEILV
jgi:hypothetical protein